MPRTLRKLDLAKCDVKFVQREEGMGRAEHASSRFHGAGSHHDLQKKIKKLEQKFDKKFTVVFNAIQLLLDAPEKPFRVNGFKGL